MEHWTEEVAANFAVLTELEEQSDRGAAILGAAYLADRLRDILTDALLDSGLAFSFKGSLNEDRIFQGPLLSFGAKIDMAAAMGFLGPHSYQDCHLVRRIRNDFMHIAVPTGFDDAKVRDKCGELWTAKNVHWRDQKAPDTPRERYLHTVMLIWNLLHSERENATWEIEGPYCMM